MSVEARGAEQFARLSKQLKEAGRKDLQKELNRAIFRATKPFKADVKHSLADNLPQHGGLAKRAAATKLTTRRRTSATAAGVRVVGRGSLSLYHLDRGQVRHRKGGDIAAGKVQSITPGVWTVPAEATAPQVRREIEQAMDRVGKMINRGV